VFVKAQPISPIRAGSLCRLILSSTYLDNSSLPQLPSRSSRDEKPVTATPLLPTLTNCDARNPFRFRSYADCRVSPTSFHFGTHPSATPVRIASFFSCTYGNLFCNSFLFKFMQQWGGVPPWKVHMELRIKACAPLWRSVTGRGSRASLCQTGCWPPICFFKVTDGHASNTGQFCFARARSPFPGKEFQVSTQLAKSVECLLPFAALME
jgi:hypothetical protein